jgi:hypothetical protein
MPQVSETIPDRLQPRVDAALNWFNASNEAGDEIFKVTGILDADKTLEASDELQLILCGGDRCEQRTFRVSGEIEPFSVHLTDRDLFALQPEKTQADLDPPPGVRADWLDNILSQHAFVVLLFYRGFW